MVRIGEYSPNFRGNKLRTEGGKPGIFGFGEYEEKRKYYDEQRKLEYKQYIAQQALKSTCCRDSTNKSQIPAATTSDSVDCTHKNTIATFSRREIATQTLNMEQRDASTNTEIFRGLPENLKQDSMNALASLVNENKCNHVKSTTQYNQELRAQIEEKKNRARELERKEKQEAQSRNKWLAEEYRRELERTGVESVHGPPGNLKQHSVNSLTSLTKAKNHHHLNATMQYEQELRAQIEEKKSRARELERREQQEAESRERWLAEEARREVERHGVEEKRIKPFEDFSVRGLPVNLKQDSVNSLTSLMNENTHRHVSAATQYEQELKAQIEEKKIHARELERREQQEAKSRERWLAEEARRELERRGVEEQRIKALEDCRMQRLEDFRNCSEQLQREAKESRRNKMRDRREVHNATKSAGSDGGGNIYSSGEIVGQQTPKSIPKDRAVQSQLSDKPKWSREQCDPQEGFLKQNVTVQEVPRKAMMDEGTPKASPAFLQTREDGICPISSPEENSSNSKILSHLGELRRHLATEQMKMEGALKKIKSPDKTI